MVSHQWVGVGWSRSIVKYLTITKHENKEGKKWTRDDGAKPWHPTRRKTFRAGEIFAVMCYVWESPPPESG